MGESSGGTSYEDRRNAGCFLNGIFFFIGNERAYFIFTTFFKGDILHCIKAVNERRNDG